MKKINNSKNNIYKIYMMIQIINLIKLKIKLQIYKYKKS